MRFIFQLWRYFLVLEKNKYNLRSFEKMKQQKIKAIRFGLETALYYASQLNCPEYKVILVKSKIKYWK